MKKLLLTVFLSLVLIISTGVLPSAAAIRTQVEAPGQMLYQSRQSLRDQQGNNWKLILFKRVSQEGAITINLRVVGFPGQVVFNHPQALLISSTLQEVWEAPDLFADKNPGLNIGQYDLANIIKELSPTTPVYLTLPLATGAINLKVPTEVVLEWQTLAK